MIPIAFLLGDFSAGSGFPFLGCCVSLCRVGMFDCLLVTQGMPKYSSFSGEERYIVRGEIAGVDAP